MLNFLGSKFSPIFLKNSLSIMPGLSAFLLSCTSGSDGCVLCNTLSAAPFALLLSCVLCNTFFRFCRVLYSAISSPLAVTEKLYSLSRISAISCRVSPLSSQFSISFRRNLTAADKWHCCKVSDEAAFCLIQRPYISKTLLTRRISPRGSP